MKKSTVRIRTQSHSTSFVLFCVCCAFFYPFSYVSILSASKQFVIFIGSSHRYHYYQSGVHAVYLLCYAMAFYSLLLRPIALSLSVLPTPSICLSASPAASLTLNSRKWFLTSCHSLSFCHSFSISQNRFPHSVAMPDSRISLSPFLFQKHYENAFLPLLFLFPNADFGKSYFPSLLLSNY